MDREYFQLFAERTPQRSAVKSSFIQKCMSAGSVKKGLSFDNSASESFAAISDDPAVSFVGQGKEGNSNISGIYELDSTNRYQNSPSMMKGDFANTSKMDFTNISKMDFTNITKGEFDTTVILDADSGSNVIDAIFDEFLQFFLSYSGEHEVFDLLQNYEGLCYNAFESVSKVIMKHTLTSNNFSKVNQLLCSLQLERNTWRLLRILFHDRMETDVGDEGELLLATLGKMSDKQVVENLYQRDAYIRQSQLIIDWLEKNADEDFQCTFFDKFEYFTDKCLALEHSLNELMTLHFKKNQTTCEMDPDAHFRKESDPLHETDRENEDRLFKFMFICIRAGKLVEAQQLAEKFGEAWLAAALEGWRLHHDPNYENEIAEGQQLQPIEGNKYRDLWKTACWEASSAPVVPVHEQALFGSLCGNLKAVLSVCKTWEDYLWAYVRTSLDKLIEQEIRNSTQQERSLEDLPMEYWDKVLDIDEIFQELEACESMEVKHSTKVLHHVIQKYIILDDIGGLIEEMYSWLNTTTLDAHTLRCMAHIILFLRVIGRSTKEELCIPILEAYVQELIKSHKVSLVAAYTSTLPKEQQIMWYARFLEGITDNEERQKCLQYAEDAGLDVPQITKSVVKNIREKDSGKMEVTSDLSAVTTEEDFQKIHAIDWLIFNPTQRAEAMKQANALMRVFVAQRKTDAAKLLFSKIPQDSVAVMMQLSKAKGLEELSADDDNATREYLCFKAYLEAMEAFNDWFHHSIHAKPKEPPVPSGEHVNFKEKVAYEHELMQHHKDLKRWQSVVNVLASTASECLYNVLLFVNGGWMVDQRTDGTADTTRQIQMSHLRKLCIPYVSRLLQELLLTVEKFREAIQLSDIVASERYQLYKEFTQEDLKQFMRITLDSSFALLDRNVDPLGYNC